MLIIVICLLMKKKSLNSKLTIKTLTLQLSSVLEATATVSREISLNGNVYDFSVDYNSIDKSDILNIQKYLMTKNNIK